MSVDYFLLEGPRAVPEQFKEWERLEALHIDAANAFFEGLAGKAQAVEAGDRARLAEAFARAAFLAWMKGASDPCP